eukprot:GGOE01000654.1.p1 GENE.GGOE01000654.1~~GGOE01000654.1.p1  ORF type:complete len:137 (-),score=22.49 GGOE01000654.1:205-615(-)
MSDKEASKDVKSPKHTVVVDDDDEDSDSCEGEEEDESSDDEEEEDSESESSEGGEEDQEGNEDKKRKREDGEDEGYKLQASERKELESELAFLQREVGDVDVKSKKRSLRSKASTSSRIVKHAPDDDDDDEGELFK